MNKGTDTRKAILKQALNLSSETGLEGLTIGTLAKRAGMSKSGLYAHFQSKEELQSQVLDAAAEHVGRRVIAPALKEPRGLPRLEVLFDLWLGWAADEFSGGCPFIAAATEFDDRAGPVRDRLADHLNTLLKIVARAATIAVEEGHFSTELDVDQFAFDFWSALLGYHHFSRMLNTENARHRAKQSFAALVRNAQGR